MATQRKVWWKGRKLWGTILAALVRLYAPRYGFDAEAAEAAALLLIGGVTAEALIDAASAFGRSFRGEPAVTDTPVAKTAAPEGTKT